MRPTIYGLLWLNYDIVYEAIPVIVRDYRRCAHTRWGGSLVNDVRVLFTGEASVRMVDIYHDEHNTNQKLRTLQHAR